VNEVLRAFAARPLYYGGVIFLYCLMLLLIINVVIASFEWWL
jgi:hypothetical protein